MLTNSDQGEHEIAAHGNEFWDFAKLFGERFRRLNAFLDPKEWKNSLILDTPGEGSPEYRLERRGEKQKITEQMLILKENTFNKATAFKQMRFFVFPEKQPRST